MNTRRSELFARILAAGTLTFAVFSVFPGAAQATGLSGWAGSHQPSKRPLFRPWQERAQTGQRVMRWRPQPRSIRYAVPAPRYQAASRQPALIVPDRAPVSRAFGRSVKAGVRFRPTSRNGVGRMTNATNQPLAGVSAPGVQSQFRPEHRQRLPYERLQANAGTTHQFRTPFTNRARNTTTSAAIRPSAPRTGYWRSWQ